MTFQDLPRDPSLKDPLPPSPLGLLARWLEEAQSGRVQRNPWAMTLATVDSDGRPAARVVLCRGYEFEQGFLVFYTNRRSRKGKALVRNPYASAVFHWDSLERQVRIEGPIVESPDSESDRYFASRPRPAQISAWASDQSEPIASRDALLERLAQTEARLGATGEAPVPRPPHWGGYRLFIESVELWVGAQGRAHDRALWTRDLRPVGEVFASGNWSVVRLQP
jgi:pyridoxamine 5'-phosphate oxidase